MQVKDAAELERVLGELLADPARRAELGEPRGGAVAENLGAVDRTVEMILQHLKARGIYVAPNPAGREFRHLTKSPKASHILFMSKTQL